MRIRKTAAAASVVLALAATAACGGKEGTAGDKPKGGEVVSGKYTVAKDVKLDSPTLKAAQKRGKLIIGAKADQPYLGFEDTNGKRSGFDIEIAKMVAADLGFSEDQIEFKTVDSNVRETSISKGQVDYYVGTYTINDERKKQVGFAGPYYVAGADLLVRKDEKGITGADSVKGKKVCSIVGSTPLQEIKKPKYGAKTTELGKYSLCVKQLLDGQVDAVTTDDAILKGYAAQRPSKLRVVGKPFTEEPYGVGMNKDDKALRDAISDALEKHIKNGDYKKAYEGTLGKSGSAYVAPKTPLPRY
ncbi:glutamate ABC transporter substrate-binding protein [Streptomyces sp. NBS 14/10]|uniref:glutamate ABC transporter substrate-binding protein n=1 Tax=Streptomyces sp. NBS 14/10 TaxID=1945643 RepID=UPI000B7CD34C|nr:glutamate ABC transporter substrate-binding protein [Streptomyces sp. NBS 14/10]KAK1182580.1 glutamate ABC transporter substrate-binding protein [Streptomyces sp. NBS 14/10]NUP45200.1 glutamate ABC transporter substrate-binding protein [Streptomyces sp.]NUS90443.1 glutamate ABC transporter substrate-binding protein [Streptomyces sp.]